MVTLEEQSRLKTLLAIPRLFLGGIEHVNGVTIRPVDAATVESDRPLLFHVDGEAVQGETRLAVRVLPKALLVSVR